MLGTESAEEEMSVGSDRGYETDVLEAVNGNIKLNKKEDVEDFNQITFF